MNLLNALRPRVRKRLLALHDVLGYRPRVFCLVTGSPRSGTSAVVRWLGAQPDVTAFNESRVLVGAHGLMREAARFKKLSRTSASLESAMRKAVFRYYAEQAHYAFGPVLLDKEPLEPIAFPEEDYADFVSDVRALVPDVKLLLMIRDPISTVWSMTQRQWGYSLTSGEVRSYTLEEHVANWCACADLVLRWASDSNTYVCQYGRLTTETDQESARVARFLGLGTVAPFQPKPSASPKFSPEDLTLIRSKTDAQVEALAKVGLSNL